MSQPGLLSAREHDYFSEYNQVLNEYFDGIDFDLTADIKPPKELFTMPLSCTNNHSIGLIGLPILMGDDGLLHSDSESGEIRWAAQPHA